MRALAAILVLALTGCGSSTAYYRHPQTQQTEVCTDDPPADKEWIAWVCIPCYFAAGTSRYADCKTEAERKGFVRFDK